MSDGTIVEGMPYPWCCAGGFNGTKASQKQPSDAVSCQGLNAHIDAEPSWHDGFVQGPLFGQYTLLLPGIVFQVDI